MHPDDTGASDAIDTPDVDRQGEPLSPARSASTGAPHPQSRRAFLHAALVKSAALTGASVAAVAPLRHQVFKLDYANAGSPPPPASVTIQNLAFSPPTLTIPQGTTVTWTNKDGFPHTSTSDTNNLWDSGAISGNGGTFSFTFTLAPGTYTYHCSIHTFMMGSVTVT